MLPPIFFDGLLYTCLLCCLTIGFTLILMTTRVWNMAHGSMATIGAFITLIAGEIWKVNVYSTLGLSFVVPAILSFIFYYTLVRPLIRRGASDLMLFVLTFAINFIFVGVINILADYLTNVYKLSARLFFLRSLDVKIFGLPGITLIAPLLTAAIIIIMHLFLTKTKFGTAMRATIENPALAGTVGVNVNLVYSVSWFLAGGLAGLAGGLLPLWILYTPYTGEILLLSVFAASMVGGTGSIYGAILGGIITGTAEVWGTYFLSTFIGSFMVQYRAVIPVIILAVCLIFVPQGLTGINWRDTWFKLKIFLMKITKPTAIKNRNA